MPMTLGKQKFSTFSSTCLQNIHHSLVKTPLLAQLPTGSVKLTQQKHVAIMDPYIKFWDVPQGKS